jgi:putative transcriptional regulator
MSYAGHLLVATPALADPNFAQTVVLVCVHDEEEGALGVVLNRPTGLAITEHLPEWASLAVAPAVLFLGGPVQVDVALGLGTRVGPIDDWTAVVGDAGIVDLASVDPDHVGALRVFAGYAGWGEGQLDAEVDRGDWFVVEADPADPFTPDPGRLRRDVLRRQGDPLRLYADYPADPRFN